MWIPGFSVSGVFGVLIFDTLETLFGHPVGSDTPVLGDTLGDTPRDTRARRARETPVAGRRDRNVYVYMFFAISLAIYRGQEGLSLGNSEKSLKRGCRGREINIGQRTEHVKTGHVKIEGFRGHFRGRFRGHPRGTFCGDFRGDSSKG